MNNELALDRINYVIKSLENTLSVCDDVDYRDDAKCEQSPAYVIGYSTATIKNALIDLQSAVNYLN